MPSPAQHAELMRSLGRLVRGLSTLFWGLPISLVVFGLLWIQTVTVGAKPNALTQWLESLNIFPPLVATSLLCYGLFQLGFFQKQERIWQNSLDRAKITATVNAGLSPFLYWWNAMPASVYFNLAVTLLMLSSLLFLVYLNIVLSRLAAMLPDETLRVETNFFTSMNLYLLTAIFLLLLLYFAVLEFPKLPRPVIQVIQLFEFARSWLLLFLLLVPVALTMTLIWKIKEVILASVFENSS